MKKQIFMNWCLSRMLDGYQTGEHETNYYLLGDDDKYYMLGTMDGRVCFEAVDEGNCVFEEEFNYLATMKMHILEHQIIFEFKEYDGGKTKLTTITYDINPNDEITYSHTKHE